MSTKLKDRCGAKNWKELDGVKCPTHGDCETLVQNFT